MKNYQPILAVYFVWHPADNPKVKTLVNYSYERLQRDVNKPFSRSLNIPVFFRTSGNKTVPGEIKTEAEKNIIFVFAGTEIAAHQNWQNYLKELPGDNTRIIPVALDSNGFKLTGIFSSKNFIRLDDFEKEFLAQSFFIEAVHEIYRYGLNTDLNDTEPGKNSAVNLFLSHTKNDPWAVSMAKDLKAYIDNSHMKNFFDATDIAPAYCFQNEIHAHLRKSTLLVIYSDNYSGRYWCQKEILWGKNEERPMICLNHLKESDDRGFPYAANVPTIHLNADNKVEKRDILRIIEGALLETVRFFFHKKSLENYKKYKWVDKTVLIFPRPPETSDLPRIYKINKEHGTVLYPEPPVYESELLFLKDFNFQAITPLNVGISDFKSLQAGISISDPGNDELLFIGQSGKHLTLLAQDLARHLLARNSSLVYGGDLREGGFTEFLFEEAAILQDRLQADNIYIHNYLAWPIYCKDDAGVKEWKAKYLNVAEMIEVSPPDSIRELIPDLEEFVLPSNVENKYLWSCSLTEMREKMIGNCGVRICAGGKLSGYSGRYPGVLEEIIIAMEKKKPLYLLGGFGGVVSRVCEVIKDENRPEELTLEWQKNHNKGYGDLVDKLFNEGSCENIDYSLVIENIRKFGIKNLVKHNGLTANENLRLFETAFIDEAIHLILKGIGNLPGITDKLKTC